MTTTTAKKYWSPPKTGDDVFVYGRKPGTYGTRPPPGDLTPRRLEVRDLQPDPTLPRGLVRDDARQGVAGRDPRVHRRQRPGVDRGHEVVHQEVAAALVPVVQVVELPAAAPGCARAPTRT